MNTTGQKPQHLDEAIKKRNNAFFRQLLFLIVLAGIGVVIFTELKFFVGSFLGAITIYVVLRNVMFRMVEKGHLKKWFASLLLVLATGVVLGAFFWVLVKAIGSEVPNFKLNELLSGVNAFFADINKSVGMKLIPDDIIQRSDGVITSMIKGILNTTYSFAANIFMMLIVLYFMLTSGRKMEAKMWEYAPFKDSSLCLVRKEVKTMIYSNAVGMPVILIAQTFVSTLIYFLLGFDNYWFWGFLTAIAGLLPLLGTAFVYVPVAIWLAATGNLPHAIILLFYGLVVISNTDNVFRIILLRKVADTHPLIVIFGVILGIPLFGFWGIIFGPLFISSFILLIRIYYMEYGLLDHPTEEELCAPVRKKVPKHFKKIADKANAPANRKIRNKLPL